MTITTTKTAPASLAIDNASPVVLRALGLRKSFGGQTVLGGVDVELRRGEVVLLEGENGSGKTTLLNILTGNLEADAGTICYSANSHATEYHFPRSWIQKLSLFNRFSPEAVARKGFGRTWQDVRLFESLSLRDNIALGQPGQRGENPFFGLLGFGNAIVSSKALAAGAIIDGDANNQRRAPITSNERINPSATQQTVNSNHHSPHDSQSATTHTPDEMLAQLGLSGREQSSGDMISLGQSKRVAIARAIAAGAKVLFLDEPLAGLDRNGIEEVLGMLSKLVADHDLTIVIIEHVFNQTHLRGLITTRWHLADGQITVGSPKHCIAEQIAEQPHWFQQLIKAADEIITEQLPRGATLTRFRINDRYKPNPVLEIKDLIVKRGKRTVIGLDDEGNETGFNLTIHQGEIAVLQAPNGWGKSTLHEACAGSCVIRSGGICFFSVSVKEATAWQRLLLGVRFFRASPELFNSMQLKEIEKLTLGKRADSKLIGKLNRDRVFSSLSGGEKRAFSLWTTGCAKLNFFDEPFIGLDRNKANAFLGHLVDSEGAVFLAIPAKIDNNRHD